MKDGPSPLCSELAEPVAVLGVGVEGMATVQYLRRLGVQNIVALDHKPVLGLPEDVPFMTGPDYLEGLRGAATVFRSPGIRPDLPAIEEARARGARITSAMNEFLSRCKARVIGVTGTVGKGTTSTLIFEMLRNAALVSHLAGNIGKSPLELLETVGPHDVVVLEISSFQAMDLWRSPEVCVVLRTTSEHLDWHTSLEEYRTAKAGLVRHQAPTGTVVYCADAPGSRDIAAQSPAARRWAYSLTTAVDTGAFLEQDRFVLAGDGPSEVLSLLPTDLRIAGLFNRENILASLLAALAAGASLQPCLEAAAAFQGLPHRLELTAEGGGVRFFNDSYATRPEATIGALGCFDGEPLALILGGSEKHADFGPLAATVAARSNLALVALIGQTAPRLHEVLEATCPQGLPIIAYPGLEPAMEACAAALPSNGGVVLMSPACASFGLFPNYKVRGETFRAQARRLAATLNQSQH